MSTTIFDDIATRGESGYEAARADAFAHVTVARVRRHRVARAAGTSAIAVTAAAGIALVSTHVLSSQKTAAPAANPRALFDEGTAVTDASSELVAKCTPDVTLADIPQKYVLKVDGTSVIELTSGALCDVRAADNAPPIAARVAIDVNKGDVDEPQLQMVLTIDNTSVDTSLVYDMASVRLTLTTPDDTPRIDAFTQYPDSGHWGMTGLDPTSVSAVREGFLSVGHEVPFEQPDARALLSTSSAAATIEAAASRTWELSLGVMPNPAIEGGYEHYVLKGYPELAYDWRSLLLDRAGEMSLTVQIDVVDPSDPKDRTTLVVTDPQVTVK
jgi:hypothetical protein